MSQNEQLQVQAAEELIIERRELQVWVRTVSPAGERQKKKKKKLRFVIRIKKDQMRRWLNK